MNKLFKKQSGFTLLELIVVVGLLGLMASLTTDFMANEVNQQRFNQTKVKLEEIKYAIIGNTSHAINGQPILYGFVADIGRLPNTLSELIYQCRDSSDIGLAASDKDSCEATSGNVWEPDWKGPYLRNTESEGSNLVFRDSWGNRPTTPDGNFGWNVSKTHGGLIVQSYGLDNAPGSLSMPSNVYEQDYPSAGELVYKADVDNINEMTLLYNGG